MGIARNVEVWIFGAFGVLVLAACLSGPSERATPAAVEARAARGAVAETELVQPPGEAPPMYVVYVVGKRPNAAEKRAMRGKAG